MRLPAYILACSLTASLSAQVQWTEFPARTSSAMSEDNSGATPRIIVFGGVSPEGTMLGDTQVLATTAASPSWQPLTTTSTPPPTKGHAMANLPAYGVVLFGGQTDSTTLASGTWIFHGNGWSQVGGAVAPPPRTGHAMALDESRNRIVMYGGKDANNVPLTDTWEFDGTSWHQVTPSANPGARVDHSMAFQPVTNTIILVDRSSGLIPNPILPAAPAWRFDGATASWTMIPGPSSGSFGPAAGWKVVRCPASNTVCVVGGLSDMYQPPQKLVGNTWQGMSFGPYHRADMRAVYDPASDRVYLSSGYTSGYRVAQTTVVWDGTAASLLQDDASPDGRSGHVLVNSNDCLYLLGGNNSNVSWYGYTPFEMWQRVGGTWSRIAISAVPIYEIRGACFDLARGRIVLQTVNGTTWEWDSSAWSSVSTVGPTACKGMAFDELRNRTVAWDGVLTWEWDGASWSSQQPTSSPPNRFSTALAYDRVNEAVLLFGGTDPSTGTAFNDTWTWTGASWAQRSPPSSAPAGTWPIATDPFRNRIVIANGTTWEWDGTTWTARSPAIPGPGYGASPMAFDPEMRKVVAFSGSGTTWEYGSTDPALTTSFGQGCPGSGAPPTVAANRLAWVNDVARFTVDVAPNPSIGLIGFSNTFWGGIPLPADLTLLGMPNCNLYTSIDWIQLLPQSTWDVAIPPLPGSVGAQFYLQAIVPDAGAGNPLQATISTPLVNVIGEK